MLVNKRASMICRILEFVFNRKEEENEIRMKAKEKKKTQSSVTNSMCTRALTHTY